MHGKEKVSPTCISFTTFVIILTKNLGCDRFRPTNASLFHVLECLLNNARSRSTSTQTKVRVKRFVYVVLHVDVLDQLLLLGEAPHTLCALPQLSFWPCWLSFIRIPHPSMILKTTARAGSTVRLVVSRFGTSFLD